MNTEPERKLLDTSGLLCPEPVMLLHKAIRDCAVGDLIEVIATDPATQRDIPAFCEFLGHELVSKNCDEKSGVQIFVYNIRKGMRS